MHPNEARVRELAAAFQAGDLDAVVNGYSDDCVYRVGGDNLVGGSYVGHQQLRDFFIRLGEVTEGTMLLELEDALGDDDHAVMSGSSPRTGRASTSTPMAAWPPRSTVRASSASPGSCTATSARTTRSTADAVGGAPRPQRATSRPAPSGLAV